VCCVVFVHDGLAARLASTPGASVIVTFPGAPIFALSSVWVVVYEGFPPAGKLPVGEVTWNDWSAEASAGARRHMTTVAARTAS
jgi:hypothetical protein